VREEPAIAIERSFPDFEMRQQRIDGCDREIDLPDRSAGMIPDGALVGDMHDVIAVIERSSSTAK